MIFSFTKESKSSIIYSLIFVWFESCDFLDTNFKGFEGMSLIQTAVVDSKFSKFNKSIDFKGEHPILFINNQMNR